MLYFSAARPAREEFADYIDENRSIRAQRLALDPARGDTLREYLLAEVRPENRDRVAALVESGRLAVGPWQL